MEIPGIEITGLLAQGRNADIFTGYSEKHGCVAVKTPGDKKAWAEIDREAALQARCQHPRIAKLLERTETARGMPALVMPYYGATEAAWPIYHDDAKGIARASVDIADAITAVHAAGAIHADVKPRNFLADEDYRLLLSDFGQAEESADAGLFQMVGGWADGRLIEPRLDIQGAALCIALMYGTDLTTEQPHKAPAGMEPLQKIIATAWSGGYETAATFAKNLRAYCKSVTGDD